MSPRSTSRLALLVLVLSGGSPVHAQVFEAVGTRALGMGGAFVAVADDATAAYWNPAGLASAVYLDARVERTRTEALAPDAAPAGSFRLGSTYLALSTPVLAVSYLDSHTSGVVLHFPPAVPAAPDRQVDRSEDVALVSLDTRHLGVTLVQSLLEGVALATTVRWVRGGSRAEPGNAGDTARDLLARADRLEGAVGNRVDADLGLMATLGPARLGLVARNLRQPEFAAGGGVVRLERQVRVGVAWTPGRTGVPAGPGDAAWTLAFDADVTRTQGIAGARRLVAAGVERWGFGRRVGVRAGVRAHTIGRTRAVAAAGVSLAARAGLLVEAQLTRGRRTGDRGWSVAGRATF